METNLNKLLTEARQAKRRKKLESLVEFLSSDETCSVDDAILILSKCKSLTNIQFESLITKIKDKFSPDKLNKVIDAYNIELSVNEINLLLGKTNSKISNKIFFNLISPAENSELKDFDLGYITALIRWIEGNPKISFEDFKKLLNRLKENLSYGDFFWLYCNFVVNPVANLQSEENFFLILEYINKISYVQLKSILELSKIKISSWYNVNKLLDKIDGKCDCLDVMKISCDNEVKFIKENVSLSKFVSDDLLSRKIPLKTYLKLIEKVQNPIAIKNEIDIPEQTDLKSVMEEILTKDIHYKSKIILFNKICQTKTSEDKNNPDVILQMNNIKKTAVLYFIGQNNFKEKNNGFLKYIAEGGIADLVYWNEKKYLNILLATVEKLAFYLKDPNRSCWQNYFLKSKVIRGIPPKFQNFFLQTLDFTLNHDITLTPMLFLEVKTCKFDYVDFCYREIIETIRKKKQSEDQNSYRGHIINLSGIDQNLIKELSSLEEYFHEIYNNDYEKSTSTLNLRR